MRHFHVAPVVLATALAVLVPACGGSGHGFTLTNQQLSVTSTALPLSLSGQGVNYIIPLSGGCNGPWVMQVIAGALPPGLVLVNANHSIVGNILDDGSFNFTIQITDTGCDPFESTTQSYTWDIGVGPVAIVDVVSGGSSILTPFATYNPPNTVVWNNPGVPEWDGIRTTIYGSFTAYTLVVAGGLGPYTCEVVDDPNINGNGITTPADGDLPIGTGVPAFSCSVVGQPTETKPGGHPFLITFEATDATNAKGRRTIQWKIDTPPIVIATPTLADGRAGKQYSDQFQIVDGVPPFGFELTTAFVDTTDPPPVDINYATTPPTIIV